jgi:hypothetical protein
MPNAHTITPPEPRGHRQLDQTTHHAPPECHCQSIGDDGRRYGVRDETHHAGHASCRVPLQLDQDERIAANSNGVANRLARAHGALAYRGA